MIIWGGLNKLPDNYYFMQGATYDPVFNFWQELPRSDGPGTSIPYERKWHTAIWTGSEMIIWGGYSNNGLTESYFNTGSIYNPFQDIWESETAIKGAPSGRIGHTTI